MTTSPLSPDASHRSALAAALARRGAQSVDYIDPQNPTRPVTLNTYRAAGYTPDRPVVFVQHGVLRNGDEYRDFWIPAADRHGLLIVAPTFSNEHWPEVECYNNGLAYDDQGQPRDLDTWTYAIQGRLWDALRAAGVSTRDKVHLFGHSAGGQFVHRLMSSQPHAPYAAVAAGNPGWYTLPVLDETYPDGLGGVGLDTGHIDRLLGFPLLILAGDQDIVTEDKHLPSNPAALRQGPHRFARAHHYVETGRRIAQERGVPFNWQLQVVPGIGHDGRAMSAVCASLWFDGRMPDAATLEALAGQRVA